MMPSQPIAGVTEWTDTSDAKLPLQMSAYSQNAEANPKGGPAQADYTLVTLREDPVGVIIPRFLVIDYRSERGTSIL
jgi:hypothetical protein